MPVITHGEHDRPIGRAIDRVRRDGRVLIAHDPGTTPAPTTDDAWLTSADSSEVSRLTSTCCPTPVSIAVSYSSKDAYRGMQTGDDIHDRDSSFRGFAGTGAGDAHQATHGLDEEVVSGQIRPRSDPNPVMEQ